VCVCVRERERERGTNKKIYSSVSLNMPQIIQLYDLSLNIALFFFVLNSPERCPTLEFHSEFSPTHLLDRTLIQGKLIPANISR